MGECGIFPARLCPKLAIGDLTLETYPFAPHLLHYLLDLNANSQQIVRLISVVGVTIHQTRLTHTRLAQQQQLHRIDRRFPNRLRRDRHYYNTQIFKTYSLIKSQLKIINPSKIIREYYRFGMKG